MNMSLRSSAYRRTLKIQFPENPLKGSGAVFLWGPRKTGKTTLLQQQFDKAKWYDLLDSDLQVELTLRPKILREEILAQKPKVVVIDEIQKVPELLDEVHWLLENTSTKVVLSGSSPRKLKRGQVNLLGGRAWKYELFPLTSHELGIFKLEHAFNHGTIPAHFLDKKPNKILKSYIYDYLREEVMSEANIRNIPAFSRFLNTVALTHGQLLNYANVARETGVSSNTVREYYQILIDTLLGHELLAWRKAKKRRLIETAKFYLFDVGIANYLSGITRVVPGTDVYGRSFEHFLIEEIRAYLSYKERDYPVAFWRTSTGYEVDLIIGEMMIAVEFKAVNGVNSQHLKGLRALKEEHTLKKAIVVSCEKRTRKTEDDIEIMLWSTFCERLWQDNII